MNAIDKGFYDKLRGNATLLAAVSGIYNGQATQGKAYPFITFFEVIDTPQYFFGSTVFEDSLYQVDIWTASDAEQEVTWTDANTILGYLSTAIDGATLTITGYTSVMCMRQNVQRFTEAEGARTIHRIMVEYRVIAQH